uniref:Uncharacterized protein n=1 Tax=Scophthalmus maximus TaxID=52904 RepID=A0A8D3DL34_SCOMX
MVLTGVIQNLFYDIGMVEVSLMKERNNPGELTWETCLPHQPPLGQHLHRLQERKGDGFRYRGGQDKGERGWESQGIIFLITSIYHHSLWK